MAINIVRMIWDTIDVDDVVVVGDDDDDDDTSASIFNAFASIFADYLRIVAGGSEWAAAPPRENHEYDFSPCVNFPG